MKNKFARKVCLWMFSAVVMAGLGYSALVLAARPAYADTVCEAEDCAIVEEAATEACSAHQGVRFVKCSSSSDNWSFECTDFSGANGNCSNF
jgi:hypothetical protein